MDEHTGDLAAVAKRKPELDPESEWESEPEWEPEPESDPGPESDPESDSQPSPGEAFVGRGAELRRLSRAVESASGDPVVMLVGGTGMGKSALLDRAARRAEASGVRVLRAEGSESEMNLPFSALHQLLRPLLAAVDELPARQRTALQHAFGTGPAAPQHASGAPDLLLVGVAVLSLLSALGDRQPVLLVLDDAQWFDRASVDALSFAARRLGAEPVTMLIAARDGDRPAGFDRHVPTLILEPLDNAAANRLLDQQPKSPTGHTRARILDQAGGNPLALVELTRAATAHDVAAGLPSVGPLPLTDHLERIFAACLDGLPAHTTRALLLLAAMDSIDSPIALPAGLPNVVPTGLSDTDDNVWLSEAEDNAWRPNAEQNTWLPNAEHEAWRPNTEQNTWLPNAEHEAWRPNTEHNIWLPNAEHEGPARGSSHARRAAAGRTGPGCLASGRRLFGPGRRRFGGAGADR